jgi:hypothetical protein
MNSRRPTARASSRRVSNHQQIDKINKPPSEMMMDRRTTAIITRTLLTKEK